MEILYIILAIGTVVYFGGSLAKLGNVAENVINTTANTTDSVLALTDDTINTYAFEVKLSNAEKRSELAANIKKLDSVTTLNDLDVMLAGKVVQQEAA